MNDFRLDRNALPRTPPPEGLWTDVAQSLDDRRRRRQRSGKLAALAAVLVIAVSGLLFYVPGPDGDSARVAAPDRLAELRALSRGLEWQVAEQHDVVLDGAVLASLVWLEMELSWLDEQLAHTPNDPALWLERIELLEEMKSRYSSVDWRQAAVPVEI